jgi:hypothetical protein
MTGGNTGHSLALRRRAFSLTDGLTCAFDYTPVSGNYHVSATPQIANARALASDLLVTGNDLRTARADYARSH